MKSWAQTNRKLAKQYDQWMTAVHYASETKRSYRRVVAKFIEFMGDKSVIDADHTDIRRYIIRVSERGGAASVIYRDIGTLRIFYDFLHLGGLVQYVAPRFIKIKRPWNPDRAPLTRVQVNALLDAATSPRDRAILEFFYGSGCRISEVAKLRIEDIDFKSRMANVHGKGGKNRDILFTRAAATALQNYIGERKKGVVFQQDYTPPKGSVFILHGRWRSEWRTYPPRSSGHVLRHRTLGWVTELTFAAARKKHEEWGASLPTTRPFRNATLDKCSIRAVVKRAATRAGLKNVTPHVLRHTFATHLYEDGAPPEIIKTLLGHMWVSTTMKYARVGFDRISEVFDQSHPRDKQNAQTA